jgi:methionyl aminopeptidase
MTIHPLKDDLWLKRQKIAGEVVSKIHREIFRLMKTKSSNLRLKDIHDLAIDYNTKGNCEPTFLGYKGFPSSCCASVNKEIVHGLGNRELVLSEGDIVKIDVGATFEGAIADCAVTYCYGDISEENYKLLLSCQNALKDAIKQFKPGNRIGHIGNAIFNRGKEDGFGVIDSFGGHGINYNHLHAFPFVPNKSRVDEGIRIHPGMSIAIEPMFVIGQNIKTKTLSDNWTVVTKNIGAHFEHSVTLDKDGKCHIITDHGVEVKDYI